MKVNENNEVKQVPEIQEQINPATDIGNYFIQIRAKDGQIIKTLVANNSMVVVGLVGEQSLLAELK